MKILIPVKIIKLLTGTGKDINRGKKGRWHPEGYIKYLPLNSVNLKK
jgi:hypothetical protein